MSKIAWNKGMRTGINKKCISCNNVFYIPPSQKHVKYCSQKCYHNNTNHNHSLGKTWKLSEETKLKQSLWQRGENNHNWKGGITDPRKSKEHKAWMRKVKKRDNNLCQICNNKGVHTHHLYSYNKYVELRFEVSNGITLCNNCHECFHKEFGYGNNSLKQFIEWMENEISKNIKNRERIGREVYGLQY